jgi:hypothetical protein
MTATALDFIPPCVDCGGLCRMYMVRDEVWSEAGMAKRGGWLCLACLLRRIGRLLLAQDLIDASCNGPLLLALGDDERGVSLTKDLGSSSLALAIADAGEAPLERRLRMRPLVYVVGRLLDEHSPHRAELLDVVHQSFPDAEILDGVAQWSSNDDWLASWGAILPTLHRVILIPGARGEVGLGGLQEVADAWTRGIPVEVVTPTGVRPLERLTLGTDVLDLECVAVAT